jgi:hypothetical protein
MIVIFTTIMTTGIHAVTLVSAITIPHGVRPGDGMDAFIRVIGIRGIHLLTIQHMGTMDIILIGILTRRMDIIQIIMDITGINMRHAIQDIRGVETFTGMVER